MTTTQQPLTLDSAHTALLIMDYQNRVVSSVVQDPPGIVERAAQVLQAARQASIPVIYIVHRRAGADPTNPDGQVHPGVAPEPGELVIAKSKPGAFSTTGLDVTLREQGVDTLVLVGTYTSGCVLSTVRWAADINYKLVVVGDACADRSAEVHRFLVERVFPWQCTVVTSQEFLRVVGVAQR